MSRYKKIDSRMWGDAKFKDLSQDTQFLWVYLLTGPHTNSLPGIYVAGEAMLSEALNWDIKRFRQGFKELLSKGMIKTDSAARLIYIPNAIKYDPPANPNVIKHWCKLFDDLPECDLKNYSIQSVKGFIDQLGEPFRKGFVYDLPNHIVIPKPLPLPEPLPKPKLEKKQPRSKSRTARLSDTDWLAQLKSNPAYKHVDFDFEFGKMDAWLSTKNGRQKTRGFIVRWLNKIDKPMEVGNGKRKGVGARWAEKRGVDIHADNGKGARNSGCSLPQLEAHGRKG